MNAGRDYFGANNKSDASVAAASPAGENYELEEPSSDEAHATRRVALRATLLRK